MVLLTFFCADTAFAQIELSEPATSFKLDTTLSPLPIDNKVQQTGSAEAQSNVTEPTSDLIGEGDQLLITVFGQPDLTADITVGESGVITLPLVGSMEVKGKSPVEVAALFSRKLEQGQYLVSAKVSVKLVQQLSRNFSVMGEVLRPGRFPILGQMSVLDALSMAGGISPRAEKTVKILRRGSSSEKNELIEYISTKLDLEAAKLNNQLAQKILPNDIIFVATQKNFYVYGEVRKPGMYPMEDELNVMRVLSIGGGVTERGSLRRISIYRKIEGKELKEISAGIGDVILPGDVVFVNERIF
ncbi:SLBB domain-containing protein [Undibacterium sp. SXout7W]|uniref:SLBB domain-containing protein n=1 Tax=Undibacterium sp. SXout7W TaxID=3413049 RepID=UPI003BF3C66B